jgi:type IV secretory pathway TrbD component
VSAEVVLGYLTGLRVLTDNLSLSTLMGTTLFVHFLDGLMCRFLAHNNGYARNTWTLLGFAFGIWALAVLLLLPKRQSLKERKKG